MCAIVKSRARTTLVKTRESIRSLKKKNAERTTECQLRTGMQSANTEMRFSLTVQELARMQSFSWGIAGSAILLALGGAALLRARKNDTRRNVRHEAAHNTPESVSFEK